ncbi:uncharacterized protein LOC134472857 [Cavia porcellus]|uniref:uncharacterized protein LOC134472857 n=1 Tax=Cavia porcellus TaxID=10141 RepID=UPI002FE12600
MCPRGLRLPGGQARGPVGLDLDTPIHLITDHLVLSRPQPSLLSTGQQRCLRTLGVSLRSGHGSWVPEYQAARGGPGNTCSSGIVLGQKPRPVQSNLASPRPCQSPALRDRTGWLVNSSSLQQSNVQPCTRRPPGKEPAAQQSNLGLTRATNPLPPGSFRALAPLSPCLWQTPPATDPRSTASFALPHGHTWPGPRLLGRLGSQTSRLTGEPLTLEDMTVPAQREAQHPSRAAMHQLLASVRRLEWQAAHLGGRASWKPLGLAQQGLCLGNSPAFPARSWNSRPVLASCDERRRQPHGHREITDLWVTQGTHAGHSDSQAPNEPGSPEISMEMRAEHFHDSERAVLPAQPLRPEDEAPPGPTYGWGDRGEPAVSQGWGSGAAWPGSAAFSSVATAKRALPGPEEACTLKEPGERTASSPPGVALARRGICQVEPREAG